ncbi:MAG TPA: glycosyltransferase [Pyrinomonadaceae bacterium]
MLPDLLYVGDVPVESSYHGSAILYRLLENYSGAKLTIVETGSISEPERRLPNVTYFSHPIARSRFLNTRLHPYAVAWFSMKATGTTGNILKAIGKITFQSVLTVAHGYGWLAAARLANERRIPLHFIVHDDWPRVVRLPPGFQKWLDRRFAAVYSQASSVMCVSPNMRDAYSKRYGINAEVLYPIRAAKCPEFGGPPDRLSKNNHPFTVAFAGTINSPGYVTALKTLYEALESVGGRLLIFGPLSRGEAGDLGLDLPNVDLRGLLPWTDLLAHLRSEADALFVPMSFSEADSLNMEMAFPSKLADYTAVGLPLLIYGPRYCSAVRWASENPGTAEVVDTEGTKALTRAVDRLAKAPVDRLVLAQRALEVGRRYFSHGAIESVFSRAVSPVPVTGQLA